ncbi:MAG: TolC family protein [Candidatus Eremiobacteraeota bacterium]|nr:TolC family protein [Candidatus Eremiobacteraeota bacterium]MBV8497979.1 TolC family protein [Candidatus Eremiobacteraeota bacterium]
MTQRRIPARALVTALALSSLVTGVALAQSAPDQGQIQGVPGVQMPSPLPQPTVSGTPIPYPAYGTPAPDVALLKPKKGVPQSISLADAIRIGVALSPTFALQNAQWAAVHAKYAASVQAYYPGVSGTAQTGKSFSNGTTASGGGVARPSSSPGVVVPNAAFGLATPSAYSQATFTNESAGITIQQLIYDGGRTIANIRAAKAADIAGRATLLRQLQTLALSVANAYYAVLEDNATVTADAQLVREFEVNEASVAAQIRNGAAARSDIAAAQFQTAQARGQLVTAQGTAIGAQATFATTLGLDADSQVVPKSITSQPPPPNPNYTASLSRALIMRPDYISAAYNVESAKENLRYAKLARFPVLSAGASDTISKQFINCFSTTTTLKHGIVVPISECPGPQSWANDKVLGLNLSIPIYDQGQTNYNVAVAASQLDQAVATLNSTRLTVESDVRSALATLISARASLVQARSELTSAQVSLDATQAQYKVGATTILNVVTAEANLSTAQSAYITALYGVQTAEQNYLYATGISDVQI